MPLASYQSTEAALSELEAALNSDRNQRDLCLSFRRKATGAEILRVGGRWNKLTGEFTDPDPPGLECVPVWVNENQVPVVEAFRDWLEARVDGKPRKRLLLTGGNRRGGKSYIVTALACAASIALPGAIVWLVSPNLSKRDELERYVKRIVPEQWRAYRGMPVYRFTLANGSTLQSITGDTADALKRGEADLIAYNEPQDCAIDVLTYGAPAIIDRGGVLLFAGNPSRRKKGEWFTNLRNSIIAGEYPHGQFIDVPAQLNTDIDQSARADIGQLLQLADPKAAAADDLGLWLPVGDRAYHQFRKRAEAGHASNVARAPDIGDVTAAVLRRKGITSSRYRTIVGADFQLHPWHVGIAFRAFGDPARPVYWAVGEVFTPEHEDDFIDDLIEAGFDADSTVIAADASGTWQDGAHRRGRTSFDFFKARRYRIEAPRVAKDESRNPRNPDVEDRVGLVNKLLAQGRLMIDPVLCPRFVEALADCEAKGGRPVGKHAHATDAAGYALFWAEPPPRRNRAVDPSRLLDRSAGPRLTPI
jgi:hypothetical protein